MHLVNLIKNYRNAFWDQIFPLIMPSLGTKVVLVNCSRRITFLIASIRYIFKDSAPAQRLRTNKRDSTFVEACDWPGERNVNLLDQWAGLLQAGGWSGGLLCGCCCRAAAKLLSVSSANERLRKGMTSRQQEQGWRKMFLVSRLWSNSFNCSHATFSSFSSWWKKYCQPRSSLGPGHPGRYSQHSLVQAALYWLWEGIKAVVLEKVPSEGS